ncbi:hypothetical protein [Brevundimonas sp.]|uniref:hypothetical protein n=1 Tax=Brevundimonas sp. TaxID=1871086 RepID=UPI0028A0822F|nr:hypothetical protein [Brevundimonas sp.]
MPDERRAPSFKDDLVALDAELAARTSAPPPDAPDQRRAMIAGLLAGMALVGRPRDMHAAMERLANAGATSAEVERLTP